MKTTSLLLAAVACAVLVSLGCSNNTTDKPKPAAQRAAQTDPRAVKANTDTKATDDQQAADHLGTIDVKSTRLERELTHTARGLVMVIDSGPSNRYLFIKFVLSPSISLPPLTDELVALPAERLSSSPFLQGKKTLRVSRAEPTSSSPNENHLLLQKYAELKSKYAKELDERRNNVSEHVPELRAQSGDDLYSCVGSPKLDFAVTALTGSEHFADNTLVTEGEVVFYVPHEIRDATLRIKGYRPQPIRIGE